MATQNMQLVTVNEQDHELVVVYDGPRGVPGRPGTPADPGAPGRSIRVLGSWASHTQYASGDAVTARSLAVPGFNSLWIARDGVAPTMGVEPRHEPTAWVEVGASEAASGSAGSIWNVSQLAHPFTRVGQPATFRASTGRYELADTRYADQMPVAVVREIVDAGQVVLQSSGRVPGIDPEVLAFGTFEPGVIYYLSTVPGELQREDPRSLGEKYSVPVLVPDGAGNGLLLGFHVAGLSTYAHVGDTMPVNAKEGDLWYRTDAFEGLYVRVPDASGALVWVQSNG